MKSRMRKHLSAPGLLSAVRKRFSRIADPLEGKVSYSLEDCLMSALAMFGMKFPSMLQFDKSQDEEHIRHNLNTLYGVKRAPCDTRMRERLDEVDPQQIRRAFQDCFSKVQRGNVLPAFYFLEDYVLVSVDGTGYFHSNTVHCDNCCQKKHRNGTVSYYHQMLTAVMVHPDNKEVLPLAVEPILKQDGSKKNDCERNAAKRLLQDLRKAHPKMKIVIVEDALYGNAPHIKELGSHEYDYIIGVKPKDHEWLFDWVNASACHTQTLTQEGTRYELRWCNQVPLNASNEKVKVNFLECIKTTPKGKTTTFTWVTSFNITKTNAFTLVRGGRARWKIENETFNTLKTQGYHFEHNFGHGYKHLSTVLAHLMLLAFLIDQIQQMSCPLFQAALKKCWATKIVLWGRVRHLLWQRCLTGRRFTGVLLRRYSFS